MPTTAHLYRVIQDSARGGLVIGATVAVCNPGTATPISAPLFTDENCTLPVTNPFISSGGVVDIYLQAPQTVALVVTYGTKSITVDFLDVFPAAENVLSTPGPVLVSTPAAGQIPYMTDATHMDFIDLTETIQQTDLSALYAPRSTVYEGTTAYVYGTSYDVLPPPRATAGQDWQTRLLNRLAAKSVTSYAMTGKWSVQAATMALGAQGTLFPTFPTGSIWHASTRTGFAVVNTYANDVINILTNASPAPTAMTTADVNAKALAINCLLATLGAATKTEIQSATSLTYKTTPWSTVTGPYSNGSVVRTTTATDYLQFTVPGNAAGYVHLVLLASDTATATPASVTINVNSVDTVDLTSASQQIRGFIETGGSGGNATISFVPNAVKVPIPTSGTVTLRLINNDGGSLSADCILTPATNPMPVVFLADPVPNSAASSPAWSSGQVATITANQALYEAAVRPVVATFAPAVWTDSTLVPTTDLSYVDGFNPNDRGMRKIADEVEAALGTLGDVDGLYGTL